MNLPQTLPSSIEPPLVLAPDARLFARRAARLRALAPAHAMEQWMGWLARLADGQQTLLDLHAASAEAAHAPWQTVYPALCAHMGLSPEADAARLQARADACMALARGTEAAGGREEMDLLVAAALQVEWTLSARQHCAKALPQLMTRDQCPCCGSAAIGGVVMAGDGRGGLRYLECALCATRWHRVRAHCSLCESDRAVEYLGIEGSKGEVQAEACPACSGYIKLFFEARAPGIDPVADDLATLVLDVLVGEDGFARGAPNLFLLAGEAV